MERPEYNLSTMFRRLATVIRRFRVWARGGSAGEISKEALEARRQTEIDYTQQGGWKL
jgi:hypothetical protein